MNALTEIQPQSQLNGSSALMLELAKCLKLVAPISMLADAQMVWLQAAVDALDGIHAHEVIAVSAELRRTVTRPSQIVPEIAKLVAEKRARQSQALGAGEPVSMEWDINREAQRRRNAAHTQQEIEAAWQWERDARIAAGLHVKPIAKPLTSKEIAGLAPAMVRMGLKCGALAERDGKIVNGVA